METIIVKIKNEAYAATLVCGINRKRDSCRIMLKPIEHVAIINGNMFSVLNKCKIK